MAAVQFTVLSPLHWAFWKVVIATGKILKRSRTFETFAVLDAVSEKLMPLGKLFLLVDEMTWMPSALAVAGPSERASASSARPKKTRAPRRALTLSLPSSP